MKQKRAAGLQRRTLYTVSGRVGPESDLVNAALVEDSVLAGTGISLVACEIRGGRILQAERLIMRGCHLEMVDAASARMERSGWRDSTTTGSRFTGASLNEANMDRVVFSDCRMNLMQCQSSKLRNVKFEACDLRGAYFNGSDLTGTGFEGSDLTGADFSGTTLARCDFRRAIIADIRVAPEQLMGVIVTSDQALYLARVFGLDIRE
jgi:uncharacterized protein YjbI with pentapeptide repeats